MLVSKNKLFFVTLVFMMVVLKFSKAQDEEDDDMFEEFLIDILVGSAMAVCETNAMCSTIMWTLFLVVLFINLVLCCINGLKCYCCDVREKEIRRMGSVGASYYITRSLIR